MGKLEDMLASGRAPTVLVRGSAWRKPVAVDTPAAHVISDAQIRARQVAHDQNFAREAQIAAEVKARTRSGRKSEDRLAKVGTMSLEAYCGIQKQLGEEADVAEVRNRAIKDAGGFFPGADV